MQHNVIWRMRTLHLAWMGGNLGAAVAGHVANTSGQYGFLSYFAVAPTEIINQVDDMMDVGIVDIQFYDWFDNYAGQYQTYIRHDVRGKDPQPEWWRKDTWTDPWDSHTMVRRDTLTAALDRIRARGGRSWAYLQAVGSEYWDLAGPPNSKLSCANPFDSVLQNAVPIAASPLNICKLRNHTNWVFHESPQRAFPAYFMSADLGVYQSHAWIPIVKELGFSGIHWDTLGVKAASYYAESSGVQAFVRSSKPLVAAAGLQQTLNQVDAHWWDRDLFLSGILAFPYSEVWGPFHEVMFWQQAAGLKGAVIANYPGTKLNGCCCITETDCHLCADATMFAKYENCPANVTQDHLLQVRWKEACSTGARYIVVGNGLRRLVTEFFPWTVPLSKESLELISTSNCNLIVNYSPLPVDGSSSSIHKKLVLVVSLFILASICMIAYFFFCLAERVKTEPTEKKPAQTVTELSAPV